MLLRIEDHDRQRSRPEYEASILEDLAWLGFMPTRRWCARASATRSTKRRCAGCATQDLSTPASARGATSPMPAAPAPSCAIRAPAPKGTGRSAGSRASASPAALRGDRSTTCCWARRRRSRREQCGDLLARDRHGYWTYQFAATVDDFEQGVDLVIRGMDLCRPPDARSSSPACSAAPTPPALHAPSAGDEVARTRS